MSTDETSIEVTVTIAGEQVRLVFPSEWTFAEAKLGKAVSEGLAPDEITDRLMVGDPDAGLAILRVSYNRAGLEWPQNAIMDEGVALVGQAIGEAERKLRQRRPPTSPTPSGSESTPAKHVSESSEAPSLETT